jgi:hypothetical protein
MSCEVWVGVDMVLVVQGRLCERVVDDEKKDGEWRSL